MKILVSGLLNTETTAPVRSFPINYYPIDYTFFGVKTATSGVAFNIAKAMKILGDDIVLTSMLGNDFSAEYVLSDLNNVGISDAHIRRTLPETPSSVVLYDPEGKRQVYCDLKNIQESNYDFDFSLLEDIDLVIACNINFNRDLLKMAKEKGKLIATDVHVLSDINDDYNRDFMNLSDILFLSDECIGYDYKHFIYSLAEKYNNRIIVLGRGSKGAAMYFRDTNEIVEMPACHVDSIVNTVGAGDALFSSFLHYFVKGYSPVECLKRAQIFASRKILANGASSGFITESEVEALI